MKFSKYFKLNKNQRQLDFVDIDTSKDTKVYVDPYAIEVQSNSLAEECNEVLREFFVELLNAIKRSDQKRIAHLVSNFHEPTDTFFGESKGEPNGKGVGQNQSALIVHALSKSVAARSGLLQDLSDAALFIPHIARDKISDLTTNLIRRELVSYTKAQCELHGITGLENVPAAAPMWSRDRLHWVSEYVDLPMVKGKPVLLVPKVFVRRDITLQGKDFYDKTITDYLVAEHNRPGDALVTLLKGKKNKGKRVVYKKSVRAKYKFSPEFIEDFAAKHPAELKRYKEQKRLQEKLGLPNLGDEKSDISTARDLIDSLKKIPSGNKDATRYHEFMIGVLTFLFYPGLVNPVKELEINEGRKRIDIHFDNTGLGFFFAKVLDWKNTLSSWVPVECKNYGADLSNPEVDQLIGRFSPHRGRFGIIVCRSLKDPVRMNRRLKDAVSASQGYPIVLTDDDILAMLEMVLAMEREKIQSYLNGKLLSIVS